ncbi:Lrp/AsnC family transcriptional regulator [Acidimangrovimonas sediminis]|uniref:Lrp/AsnC family transcriptional regulator n=1 Tax=Acidimangrovimonas sediminis TaxID=2056283 RepID=UPI000C806152|nr:Lrp/AsnC family transcriptional regulator [Acidimangrovimonas sediminis]
MDLDEKDRAILAHLARDSRVSNAELAERVGMSTSALWRRVKAFEEAGIIESYGARLNPARMGLGFHAIVHVQLVRHDPERLGTFLARVASRREIEACYATTGQADYHLLVRCADIEAYNRFLEEFLFQMHAVRSAQTNVVLRDLKKRP